MTGKRFATTSLRGMAVTVAIAAMCSMAFGTAAAAGNGVISTESPYSVKDTMNRVAVTARMQGMKVVARIDHAAAARRAGKQLRAAEVAVISAPSLETDVMACGQSAGLDMPSKLMAWQDISGDVWLSYGHPAYVVARHNLSDCDVAVRKLADALEALVKEAVGGKKQ